MSVSYARSSWTFSTGSARLNRNVHQSGSGLRACFSGVARHTLIERRRGHLMAACADWHTGCILPIGVRRTPLGNTLLRAALLSGACTSVSAPWPTVTPVGGTTGNGNAANTHTGLTTFGCGCRHTPSESEARRNVG